MTTLTNQNENRSLKSILLNPWVVLFIGIAAATFAAPFMKLTQNAGMPTPLIAAGRMFLAATIISPLVLSRYTDELKKLSRRDWVMAMIGGFFLVVHFMFLISALEITSILLTLVIVNTGPLWVALIERFFLKQRMSKGIWAGLFVAIIGSLYIAFNAGASGGDTSATTANPLFGAGLSLVAAIAGASYITMGRSVRQKVSLFPYVWIVFGFGGIIGTIYLLSIGISITGHPTDSYGWLIMLTLIPQLIGHSSFNYVLGYITATITSLSSQIVTLTGAIAAFFMFGEIPQSFEIIGSVIIVGGVLIALFAPRPTSSSTERQPEISR